MSSDDVKYRRQFAQVTTMLTKVAKQRLWADQVEQQVTATRASVRGKITSIGFPSEMVDKALDTVVADPEGALQSPEAATETMYEAYRIWRDQQDD